MTANEIVYSKFMVARHSIDDPRGEALSRLVRFLEGKHVRVDNVLSGQEAEWHARYPSAEPPLQILLTLLQSQLDNGQFIPASLLSVSGKVDRHPARIFIATEKLNA